MDAIVDSSGYAIHIHNYSIVALRSFIAEVKKYPIIFNGINRKDGIPLSSGLIDFAWARIVAALLNNSVQFDLPQRRYWERSFRVLWKWMKSVLKQDMIERQSRMIHILGADKSWLADLKFLEPHIQTGLADDFDSDSEADPALVSIESGSSEAIVDLNDGKRTVIWLLNSFETSEEGNAHISICLRVPLEMCADLNKKPPPGLGVIVPHGDSSTSSSILTPSSSIALRGQPSESRFPAILQSHPPGSLQIDTTTGPSVPSIYDEDYQYVMSLLPKLQKLPPNRKAEVKIQMIQAMHESLN